MPCQMPAIFMPGRSAKDPEALHHLRDVSFVRNERLRWIDSRGDGHAEEMGAEYVTQTVSYFQAWQLWANGNLALRDMSLWGVPIFWWGRVGKVFALLAGVTLILDIIGKERLARFSSRYVKGEGALLALMFLAIGVGISTLTGKALMNLPDTWWRAVLIGLGLMVPAIPILFIGTLFSEAIEKNRITEVARWISVVLLVGGFHFDMLAS